MEFKQEEPKFVPLQITLTTRKELKEKIKSFHNKRVFFEKDVLEVLK